LLRNRQYWVFALTAIIGAFLITRGLVEKPGFTDVFYHFNAANRLASGQGLTDAYLWTYIGAPDELPAPSHLYWMPLTSLTAAFGMWVLNAPGSYAAAQWPFALMLAGTAGVAFWLGGKLGGTNRHAWAAGLNTLLGGFYARFWGAVDTFAPYALVGSLCLVGMAQLVSASKRPYFWAVFTGAMAALGHLTRADGVLLLLVGWLVLFWDVVRRRISPTKCLLLIVAMTLAYLLVMSPWFVRNFNAVGSPLPVGGSQGIWYTEYNDIFNYPPDASPFTLFVDGVGLFLSSRWEAFTNNLGNFFAVEGIIVLTPLMLIGLWKRRANPFLRGFWLYALGVHFAMTFVFPFPGYRGGLIHSATALLPWWAALALAGLDDAIEWLAQHRRRWNAQIAKRLYSGALVVLIAFLTLYIALPRRVIDRGTPPLYSELKRQIPTEMRVMINDPAQLYYYTGHGGVVLPNENPEVILEIARRYKVDYLVLEQGGIPAPMLSAWDTPPDFLEPLPVPDFPNVRLYAVRR
jgi:hypothetical protein